MHCKLLFITCTYYFYLWTGNGTTCISSVYGSTVSCNIHDYRWEVPLYQNTLFNDTSSSQFQCECVLCNNVCGHVVFSSLHLSLTCSRRGCMDVMRCLVTEAHCDPNARDNDGETPLHWACRWAECLVCSVVSELSVSQLCPTIWCPAVMSVTRVV